MVEIVHKLHMTPCTCMTTCTSFFINPILMVDSRVSKEDARRLVASWNYLRNVPIEDLEKDVVNKDKIEEEENE